MCNICNFQAFSDILLLELGTNMYVLAPENEFPEIIYVFFGERQNIFSTIFGTKFVVICAAKSLKIG